LLAPLLPLALPSCGVNLHHTVCLFVLRPYL
jgi:hypothetical protein